jgi:hypothetical protein
LKKNEFDELAAYRPRRWENSVCEINMVRAILCASFFI